MEIEEIKRQAKKEFDEEIFRQAVEEYKTRLRNKRPIWDRIFPYRIVFIRKEKL